MLDTVNEMTIVLILAVCVAILFILLLIQMISSWRFKRKVTAFLGVGGKNRTIEEMLLEYLNIVKGIGADYSAITGKIENLDSRLSKCLSKVAIIRYNPFKEMGGDLCFVLALLDEHSNGVVLNTIHSRESSYTYAKPVNNKLSSYNLSEEEKQVIEMAIRK
ncbi:MAG: DUF4446 family protein [Clostridiales bacterium]|jgi:hypothetical protein|nr:DUF4446 family protein [Clostridiales bacterium]